METNNYIPKNPLENLGYRSEDILTTGNLGAVLARTGVGKTSFMVQLAIFGMLQQKKVLHLSLDDSVKKIDLWYKEIFHRILDKENVGFTKGLWQNILPNRMIMTLMVDSFTVPRIEERIKDMSDQGIFSPDIMIIDGLSFNESSGQILSDIKALAEKYNSCIWFTIRIHRHESPGRRGLPNQIADAFDLFETILLISPEKDTIHLKMIKPESEDANELSIDPSTMLINT